jgi:general secretion pathway protein H
MTLRRDAQGYTLIELMIVLAVMSLVAVLSFSYVIKDRDRAAFGGAVQVVRAALDNARAAAIALDREVTFGGGIDGYRIDDARQAFGAPAGLVVEIGGRSRISFFPSGGSSGGRVTVREGTKRRDIDVEALTGHAVLLP